VFLLPPAPRHQAFYMLFFCFSSCSTKSALLAGPLRPVFTTPDGTWLKGEGYRLESSSDPSHLTPESVWWEECAGVASAEWTDFTNALNSVRIGEAEEEKRRKKRARCSKKWIWPIKCKWHDAHFFRGLTLGDRCY